MKLIVGLGNPGRDYARTRHNAGFRVLDVLANRLNTEFDRNKFKGEYATAATAKGEDLLLIKPQTYMNLSGETVQGFCGYFKVELPDLLVIVDDVALPLAQLRMRRGGSDGGHNGLRDITLRLGSQDYARLRVGVGGREEGSEQRERELKDHVLGRFSESEESLLKEALTKSADASLYWLEHGIEAAMNRYNAKPKSPKSEK